MEGIMSGIVTVNTVRSGEAPETRAASSRDGSIFSMARESVINAYG